ncbi:MAG: molybdopterin-dependent oxidoreductase [Planctomycetota bacterium]
MTRGAAVKLRPEKNSELTVLRGACAHDCPDTCIWQVTLRDGRAIDLKGDADHPFTRGVLCTKVNHYLERVYHPDRVLQPLRRRGAKGSGIFEPISWDAALNEIAERWQQIITESGAESILPYSLAGNQGLIQGGSLDRRLFGLLGCTALERNLCGVVAAEGLAATQGSPIGMDPEELRHSRLIVLWGTNTLVTNQHLWPVILDAQRHGATVVVIDPIRTRTAAAADWHLAPRPGSDAALALALMHVIVRDNLVDHDYVTRYADGYDAFVQRLAEYSPETVAPITGLPASDLERLARLYATTRPAALRPLIGMEHHRNGAMIFRTVACLPILTGAWRDRGGGLCRSTGALQFSTLDINALTRPDTHQRPVRSLNMRDLGQVLMSADLSPPIRALCVYNSNPAVTTPRQSLVIKGLCREDLFTVVHDLFVTETARYADLVLPATSQLEHLDLVPAWGHHYLSFNRPALEPVGQSVSNTEFFRRLARVLGRSETWLYDDDETLVRAALASGHPYLQGITYERLWRDGYARLATPPDWRPYAEGNFPTPSGKARLLAPQLIELGVDPLPSMGELRARLPHRATSRDDAFPLQLITGKSLYHLNSSYCHFERQQRRMGELRILMHEADARDRQLRSGDQVEVMNGCGSVRAGLQISEDVQPGVVWMPFGGHTDASGAFRSVNQLTPEEPTDWAGGSGFYDAFVDVKKIDREKE